MAHAARLGPKVAQAVHVRSHQHGDTAEDLDAHRLEALELERIVGHQLHALKCTSGQGGGGERVARGFVRDGRSFQTRYRIVEACNPEISRQSIHLRKDGYIHAWWASGNQRRNIQAGARAFGQR